jgi:transcriptional regulator with XRE-family HTH domain
MPGASQEGEGDTNMTTAIPVRQNLSHRLRDNKKFRQHFFRSRTRNKIAAELRQLRELRGLKQADLKKKFGIHQSAISRIEQAEYSSWTYKTLLKATEALDGVLEVSIRPVEALIDRYHAEETVEEAQFHKEAEREKIAAVLNTNITPKTGQLNLSGLAPKIDTFLQAATKGSASVTAALGWILSVNQAATTQPMIGKPQNDKLGEAANQILGKAA